jgi:hypothetical protein
LYGTVGDERIGTTHGQGAARLCEQFCGGVFDGKVEAFLAQLLAHLAISTYEQWPQIEQPDLLRVPVRREQPIKVPGPPLRGGPLVSPAKEVASMPHVHEEAWHDGRQ